MRREVNSPREWSRRTRQLGTGLSVSQNEERWRAKLAPFCRPYQLLASITYIKAMPSKRRCLFVLLCILFVNWAKRRSEILSTSDSSRCISSEERGDEASPRLADYNNSSVNYCIASCWFSSLLSLFLGLLLLFILPPFSHFPIIRQRGLEIAK